MQLRCPKMVPFLGRPVHLFHSSDMLVHFQTRAAQIWVMLKSTPSFAFLTPVKIGEWWARYLNYLYQLLKLYLRPNLRNTLMTIYCAAAEHIVLIKKKERKESSWVKLKVLSTNVRRPQYGASCGKWAVRIGLVIVINTTLVETASNRESWHRRCQRHASELFLNGTLARQLWIQTETSYIQCEPKKLGHF